MKKLLVGVVCAIASLPALAGDWVAGGAGAQVEQFIDYSSIEKKGNVRGAWTIGVFSRPEDDASYILVWNEYNCQTRKSRSLDYVVYDFSGSSIESGVLNEKWSRVMPGSVGEKAFRAVCKNPKPEVIFKNTAPEDVANIVRKYRTSIGDRK